MGPVRLLWTLEASMLELLFHAGGMLLFCLLITYERLSNRL